MEVVVGAQSGQQGCCCTHYSALLSISKVQKMFAERGFLLVERSCAPASFVRNFLRRQFSQRWTTRRTSLTESPRRGRRRRGNQEVGIFLSKSIFHSPAQANHHRIQRPIPRPSQYTGLANCKNRQRVQETSKKNDSMSPSSTDSPMNLLHDSWPSSALPAWARPPS